MTLEEDILKEIKPTPEECEEILAKATSAEDAVKRLTVAALQHGGKDNVTSICLFVGNEKGGKKSLSLDKLKRNRILSIFGMAASAIMIAVSVLLLLKK